jgi:hypothetical protein
MAVQHIEFLVEEPSMEAAIQVLAPKILGGVSFAVHSHQCKQDLLARLPGRLRGYASWLPTDCRIVVVVDRDHEDCRKLKRKLERIASKAGLTTRSAAPSSQYRVVNRLAIEELEAWYFGDWEAVRQAYPRVRTTVPSQPRYRNPDAIRGGTWEAFERILQDGGYFAGGLTKVGAARTVAFHMEPDRNTSRSFQVLHAALREMVSSQ